MLVHSKGNSNGKGIFMQAITAKEEDKLDRCDQSDIYFYGDIDLDNINDLNNIRKYNLVNNNNLGMLYTNFDYDKGCFTLVPQLIMGNIENVVKWGSCDDPVTWFKYNYCLLGKPDKIVVYNASSSEYWRR